MKVGKETKTVTAPKREIRKAEPRPEPVRYPVPIRWDIGVGMPKALIKIDTVSS